MNKDVPGQPTVPVPDEISKTSISLSWSPPEDDGGTEILGYFVERSQPQSSRWLRVNRSMENQCSLIVTDLIEDTEYVFRIVAANKVGEGEPGPQSDVIQAKDPWGK